MKNAAVYLSNKTLHICFNYAHPNTQEIFIDKVKSNFMF
jgi:hypothetical protein